ncbi:isoprenyl transferase [Metasolibacillus meyeri]|uniref:Isoprenyl transferase n=1 Tax=Metasolibacillus meyeri TaxID=1071052 RepID=A0AAW9NWD7_9BACL|nr:isoprenyl transferase [Metasolibacillus meyeri]MEC1179321.1 isoprenyl transferase [Metasolibacillus meyeri]
MFKKLLGRKSNKNEIEYNSKSLLDVEVPSHIAIIMDGNGRWAKKRSMPRIAGHHEGMKTVRKITRYACDLGVEILTLYAFSTENWKRPKAEVEFLMGLPEQFLNSFLPELMERNIRVQMIGDFASLPTHTQKALQHAMNTTKHNTGLILNFAMNYGSRAEIVLAMQQMMREVAAGHLAIDEVTEEHITAHLMTAHLPEPDLLIRTSGEVRLSNFMLWQLAYTEFLFTDTLWPDFNEQCLLEAVQQYQQRNRRYGGLKGEES